MKIFDIICGVVALLSILRSIILEHIANDFAKRVHYYNQGIFNNFWQIGATAEHARKSDSPEEMRAALTAINSSTQTARHHVAHFDKPYSSEVPFLEPAWEPKAPDPPRKTLLMYLFFIGS